MENQYTRNVADSEGILYFPARNKMSKAEALSHLMDELKRGEDCTEVYSEEEAKRMLGLRGVIP